MRLAVSGIAAGERQAAISVCNLIRGLYEGFSMLPALQDNIRDWKTKSDVMLQSLIKVETGISSPLSIFLIYFCIKQNFRCFFKQIVVSTYNSNIWDV